MKSYTNALFLSICICGSVLGNSWVACYSGGGQEEAYAMAVDSSGNVYVTGTSNGDYVTVKFDPNGNEVWESSYNGPSNGYDVARAITLDNAGNIYVTGNSYDDANWDDYLTVKYDPNGGQLWASRYNNSAANGSDFAYAIAVSAVGNVYVTGSSMGSTTSNDYATVKYNSSGVQQWASRYTNSSTYDDTAYAIAVDSAGNAYVTGESIGSTTGNDYATIKYANSGGSQSWAMRYSSSGDIYDSARAIALDDSNNVYITGESDANYVTIKYNLGGSIQSGWPKRYDGIDHDYDSATAIAVDASANVYVTGQSFGGDTNGSDFATVKYNTSGTLQWSASYNSPNSGWDWANAIAVDA